MSGRKVIFVVSAVAGGRFESFIIVSTRRQNLCAARVRRFTRTPDSASADELNARITGMQVSRHGSRPLALRRERT
ncbi:hypothetical protein PUN4_280277 [Paraburkholderia unamae]|nr:hypothetical protein PUN4_280277 [Paraburkholderia unamae]